MLKYWESKESSNSGKAKRRKKGKIQENTKEIKKLLDKTVEAKKKTWKKYGLELMGALGCSFGSNSQFAISFGCQVNFLSVFSS